MIMKVIYLTVKVVVKDDTDAERFVEEIDYSIDGYPVLDYEIVDYEVKQWKD